MANIITLDLNSHSVRHLCKKDKRLKKVIHMIGPITYEPHTDNPFPFLIHEIIEQMLSVKAGAKIYTRLETLCKGQVTPYSIDALSLEDVKSIGTSTAKAKYIKNAASAVLEGTLDFSQFSTMTDEATLAQLIQLPGIGVMDGQNVFNFCLRPAKHPAFRRCRFLTELQVALQDN